MIEEGRYDKPPITIPDPTGKEAKRKDKWGKITAYDLLNEAHQKDVAAGGANDKSGANEEAIISPKQAHLDNTESYRKEMKNAKTRTLLDSFKSRMNSAKSSPFRTLINRFTSKMNSAKSSPNEMASKKSEFIIRTGGNKETEEIFQGAVKVRERIFLSQDEKEKEYIEYLIYHDTTVGDVKTLLDDVKNAVAMDELRPDQLPNINKAAREKIKKLQDEKEKDYIEYHIYNDTTVGDVKTLLDDVKNAVTTDELREDQLPNINKAAREKIKKLQDKKEEEYIFSISEASSVKEVDQWLDFVKNAVTTNELRPDQLPNINKAAETIKLGVLII